MGYEYRVKFVYDDLSKVDESLRALPCFHAFDQERAIYIYRSPETVGPMPDAEVSIEKEGLYWCDYGMTPELFGRFTKRLISYFAGAQIEDWE